MGYEGKTTTKTHTMDSLMAIATRARADAILLTNPKTLANIVPSKVASDASLVDWRGSLLTTSIPIVVTQPLYHLRTTTSGELTLSVDLGKIKHAIYSKRFCYDYAICESPKDIAEARRQLAKATILVGDIETSLRNQITSISFTPIMNNYAIGKTFIIQLAPNKYAHWDKNLLIAGWKLSKELLENDQSIAWHNGCFDCFQLMRHNIVVNNYLLDTEYLWRCWYSELKKSLATIASYLLPDYYYWKHESETSPLEYNGKDTINTARILIAMLKHAPDWVYKNYAQMYPNIGPSIYLSFEGFKVDTAKRAEAKAKDEAIAKQLLTELRELTGLANFNPNSHKQVSTLMYKVLGAKKPGKAKSDSATGKIELSKVALQHPLYTQITTRVLAYKEKIKAISTYYNARLDSKDRLYYSYNIDGTETARQSCNASSLYAPPEPGKNLTKTGAKNLGAQLQNIPPYMKKAMLADDGYGIIDEDKSQSEARCVAYLSPCPALIDALEHPPETAGVHDFYCYTGYKFFGIEFDKKHPLRQTVKKIIHGTNYLMQAATFIDSVGLLQMLEYKRLLGFRGTMMHFADYLLGLYHEVYPEVSVGWNDVIREVSATGKLVTPDGWTRKVLGNIVSDHKVLRELVAHRSQHFSVVGINKAMWKLFYEVQVPSKGDFRLKGQIHDSIVSQAKLDKLDYYARVVHDYMDIPQPTPHGVLRIPIDIATSIYWKETA
jgi:DNA polymerase I-like protein with 3'-5' exonuclease and polymerase domains